MRSLIPVFAAISTLSALDVSPCSHPHPRPAVLDGGTENLLTTQLDGGALAVSQGGSSGASSIATSVATAPVIGPRAPAPTPPNWIVRRRAKWERPRSSVKQNRSPCPRTCPRLRSHSVRATGSLPTKKRRSHLVVQPIAKDGHPVGAPHEMDTPGKLDRVLGMRRLADVYVVF